MRNEQKVALAVLGGGIGAAMLAQGLRARRRIDFEGKVVAITGGSRGLGLVMARELGGEGARLALIARDRDELMRAHEELKTQATAVLTIPADVRDRGEATRAIERIVRELAAIDILINDAGIIQVGPMDHMKVTDYEDAMATHFWGPLYTMLAAIPRMKERGGGRIVNISSIGGKIATPHLVPYCASKFALTGLSDGVRAELAQHNIRVTTVCPGLMRTGSPYNAWFKGQHRAEFTWFHVASSIPGVTMDARRAAHQIIEACRYGDAELILTLPAKVAVLVNAVLPGAVAQAMIIANRLLPAEGGAAGDAARSGWQSPSSYAPSKLTTLGDRAAAENNELPAATRA